MGTRTSTRGATTRPATNAVTATSTYSSTGLAPRGHPSAEPGVQGRRSPARRKLAVHISYTRPLRVYMSQSQGKFRLSPLPLPCTSYLPAWLHVAVLCAVFG